MNLNDHSLGVSDSPSYPAAAAGRYYCIVRDAAGREAISDEAAVNPSLYFVQQPVDANLYGQESVTLACRAAGGVPFDDQYSYRWVDADGKGVGPAGAFSNTLTVTEPGEYTCIVNDATWEDLPSNTATVIDAEPLTVTLKRDYFEFIPGVEARETQYTVSGGKLPLQCEWTLDGESTESFVIDPDADGSGSRTGNKVLRALGEHVLTVRDAAGQTASVTITAVLKPLKIYTHPKSGFFPESGTLPMMVEVEDGTFPFTYTLYRSGEVYYSETMSRRYLTIEVSEPGEYYYRVTDSEGRWADTQVAIARDYQFSLVDVSVSGAASDDQDATLTATVDGGEAPITYRWVYRGTDEYPMSEELPGNGASIGVSRPGYYDCVVQDKRGSTDSLTGIAVKRAGSGTLIIQQPESQILEYREDGNYDDTWLTCKAISLDTDDDSRLSYLWEGCDPNYGWLSIYPGSTMPFFSAFMNYPFRCKVTDTETGESIYSDIVTVCPELTYKGTNVPSRVNETAHGLNRYYDFYFVGGTAPYQVKVFSHQYVSTWEIQNFLAGSRTVDSADGIYPVTFELPLWYTYIRDLTSFGMGIQPTETLCEYYAVVIDATGQVCESKIVSSGARYTP